MASDNSVLKVLGKSLFFQRLLGVWIGYFRDDIPENLAKM